MIGSFLIYGRVPLRGWTPAPFVPMPGEDASRSPLFFEAYLFAGFRRCTPGPPPFSSMNSRRCIKRAPGPPSFSSINSTPAFSRALRMADAVGSVIAVRLSNEEQATGLPLKDADRRLIRLPQHLV